MEDGKEKQVPVESHGNQSPWTMEPLLHDMEDLRESGFVQVTPEGLGYSIIVSQNPVESAQKKSWVSLILNGKPLKVAAVTICCFVGKLTLEYLADEFLRIAGEFLREPNKFLDKLFPNTWGSSTCKWLFCAIFSSMRDWLNVSWSSDQALGSIISWSADATLFRSGRLIILILHALGLFGIGPIVWAWGRRPDEKPLHSIAQALDKTSQSKEREWKEKLLRTDKELKDCKEKLKNREDELKVLQENENRAQKMNEELNERKQQLEKELAARKEDIINQTYALMELEDKLFKQDTEARAADRNHKKLKKDFDATATDLKHKRRSLLEVDKERERLSGALTEEEGNREKLQRELNKAKDQKRKMDRTISDLKKQKEDLEEELDEKDKELHRKSERLDTCNGYTKNYTSYILFILRTCHFRYMLPSLTLKACKH